MLSVGTDRVTVYGTASGSGAGGGRFKVRYRYSSISRALLYGRRTHAHFIYLKLKLPIFFTRIIYELLLCHCHLALSFMTHQPPVLHTGATVVPETVGESHIAPFSYCIPLLLDHDIFFCACRSMA